MKERLKSCFAANLNDLGPRADDVVLDKLFPLFHPTHPMTREIAHLTAELLVVRPDRPDQDQRGSFRQAADNLLYKEERTSTMFGLFSFHFLKMKIEK